jgi:hypothetical protein
MTRQPGERMAGYQKSNAREIDTGIQALPLVLFTQHVNILLLDRFRGMKLALGLSIHRIDNKTHKNREKSQWLTYTEPADVERLIIGMTNVLKKMTGDNVTYHFIKIITKPPQPAKKPERKTMWQKIRDWF